MKKTLVILTRNPLSLIGLILVGIVLFLPRGLWDPARLRSLFGGKR